MGEFLSPIVQLGSCLWNPLANRAVHIRNLKENLYSLEVDMGRLMQVYEDVKQRVEREEQERMKKRTNEVAGWLDRVQRMEAKVSEILEEGKEQEQKKCLGGCCPKNCRPTYKVGKRASKMLNDVDKLMTECRFDVVAEDVRATVKEKRTGNTVGLDLMLKQVLGCIEDTDLRIIGLYGLGGVGKTTLLKKINNEFLNRSRSFEHVIWVSVSKQPNLEKIQEEILRELQIPDVIWQILSEEKKAGTIFRILKEKKFVLLLDDIWKQLNLDEVGVPNHDHDMQKGSKVVFTTRSREICGHMDAQRTIKVECLVPEAALLLFRTKVGEDILINPRISELAEIIAARCKGLPLALITLGRTMASRKTLAEWEQEISILWNSPSQFPGMLNDVLLLLKFSFDRLENDLHKSCFLYCSLFPEDCNIRKEQLIELWLGEGLLLEEFGGLSNVQNNGEYAIGSLKRASLLETGESEEFVTMHPLIRVMALEEWTKKIKIYVKSWRGHDPLSRQEYGLRSWNEIERISLWNHGIEAMKDSELLDVRTFICKLPLLTKFPTGFFHRMPALTVLDLSNSFLLCELPAEIGILINLQYLNLSETAISELPTTLENLTKLRCLLLDCTRLKISGEMISKFPLLEVFSMRVCDKDLLVALEQLQRISEISIEISDDASITTLLCSPKLQLCLKKLNFQCHIGLRSIEVSPSLLRRMEHLELNSESLQEFKISSTAYRSVRPHYFNNLCRVVIQNCLMLDATWLIYARSLQHLTLSWCRLMKEVIGGNIGSAKIEQYALFSSLKTLHLEDLPELDGICGHALTFPILTKIKVEGCPSLKKLPFDSNSAKNSLEQIYGGRHWWEELQWDEAIKQVFSSKFAENP